MPNIVKLLMKSRTRRIPMRIHKLLEKRAMDVTDEEALRSAERLAQLKQDQLQRYGTGAALGAATYPVVGFAGDAAEGIARAATSRGPRMPQIAKALADAAKDNLASAGLAKGVTKGLLTGSGVQAIREHVSSLPDARRVDAFIAANKDQ